MRAMPHRFRFFFSVNERCHTKILKFKNKKHVSKNCAGWSVANERIVNGVRASKMGLKK